MAVYAGSLARHKMRHARPRQTNNGGEEGCGGRVPKTSGGSKGALDECGEHFDCSGIIPYRLEVQGLRKGPPSC